MNVRKTGGRNELDTYRNVIRGLMYSLQNSCEALPAIADGTTDGNLQTVVAVTPRVAGVPNAALVATDDFWDLSAEVDTVALKFRAYWLYVDDANVATFVATATDFDSEADAILHLPPLDGTKSILGVYVAGPETDFDGVAHLTAQGTIFDRVPDTASGVLIDTDITMVPA